MILASYFFLWFFRPCVFNFLQANQACLMVATHRLFACFTLAMIPVEYK